VQRGYSRALVLTLLSFGYFDCVASHKYSVVPCNVVSMLDSILSLFSVWFTFTCTSFLFVSFEHHPVVEDAKRFLALGFAVGSSEYENKSTNRF